MSYPLDKQSLIFILIILFSIIFRGSLSFLPAFEGDQSAFRFWSIKLAENGLNNFYFSDFFTSNPIGFFYILWIIGLFTTHFIPWIIFDTTLFDLLLKTPANLADIVTGIFIYFILKHHLSSKWAITGYIFYVFNPAIFFNSAIWGQYDGITALLLTISLYTITTRKNPELALTLFALSLTLKPQTISLAPILGFLLISHYKILRWSTSVLSFIATLILVYTPFFQNNPIYGIFYVNSGSANLFDCTTCFAFNFWGILGNWQNDQIQFFGISYFFLGILLYIISLTFILLLKPLSSKLKTPFIYFISSLVILLFFTFLTRMHERYLFPFFVFFLLYGLLSKSRLLIILYFVFSLLHLINLYIPYTYYNSLANTHNSHFFNFLMSSFSTFSIIFFLMVLFCMRLFSQKVRQSSHENKKLKSSDN